MSTRSSTRNHFPPLDNPELTIRRRPHVDPTLLNDFEMATNGNGDDVPLAEGDLPGPDLRTMEELYQPTLNGRGGPIALIAIQATNFGLKNDMIQQVPNSCQFHGLPGDNANKHLDKFLHVTQSIKVNGVIDDALCLYLFSHSLTHHATAWFDRFPRNSINTFEQMAKMFLEKYFPPSMVTKLRNKITNFRQHLKGITTRSGHAYKGPTIPTTSSLPKVVERETKVTKDTVPPTNNGSTKDVKPSVVQVENQIPNSEPVVAPVFKPVKLPLVLRSLTQNRQFHIRLDFMTKSSVIRLMTKRRKFSKSSKIWISHISFADAPILMPKFCPTIMSLLTNKEKLFKLARTPMNEHCLAVLLKKLPIKLGDPGKFLILCDFSGMDECLALADLRASINLMPLSVWNKLSLPELSPTCMTLEPADRSISRPVGVAEDVFVKVGTFHFSAEFVVVDFDTDPRVPLILGRSFLKTGHALIDVYEGELTLHVGKEVVTFNLDQTSRYSANYDAMYEFFNDDPSSPPLPPQELKVVEPTNEKYFINEPPVVELKDLPPHLEYAFLEGDDKLPVIIAKDLKDEEKTALIKVLKSHKQALACGSAPKKGGFTVVKNEENELNPTRLVTSWRVCIDYRKLNDATRKDHFPLPFMDQMLERLAGNEYYCFLDGFLGYFQILIDPQDQEKTTFTCLYGMFAYRRMPFGLCNAPDTFQRCMMAIFHDMIKKTMEVFMDDFSVFGNSFRTCLSYLDKMLKQCEDTNHCLSWEKSHFMVKEGIVLGHKISKNGIEVDKAKVDVIAKLPHPTTVKECIEAFQTLKRKLTEAPIRVAPDWDLPFELMCDASDFAIGAVLGQRKTKHFQPIHYASITMTDAQAHYTTMEKELLAVVYAFEKFRPYLVMTKSIVYTDHSIFNVWDIYFMGPFPSLRGNKYILVAAYYLSKWVKAKVLPTNDARVVCKILKSLFARFGTPRAIISDRDTYFRNDQFTKVMLKYDVTHRLATAYHPQTSGQVEVSNRGLKRILERTVGENRTSWSDKIDDALWAFRIAFKTPIGPLERKQSVACNKHAVWGTYHRGSKQQRFYAYACHWKSPHDVYSKRRIITVTSVKVMRWYDYGYLEEIVVRRDDNVLYKFKEGDFPRLNLRDIKDMILLLVQKKLSNLDVDDRYDLGMALRMFSRRIVILHCVEDLQLGVESYQKKLNITRPETTRSNISKLTPYTTYKKP
nr:DNA-directed DNA polymerase [Tanacetum cinerariifolium]